MPDVSVPGPGRTQDELARSIVGALAYADLFDYPLTAEEVTHYQVGTSFSFLEVAARLAKLSAHGGEITREGDFFCLRGRESIFDTRRIRSADSARVWRRAHVYARWVSRLPFVRMVAVTGALAVDNIAARPDIDLLVVTGDGRVWIGRRFIIGLVRLARLFGDEVCPNYIISRAKLDLEQQDLFTAHELAQMVPLYGSRMYHRMIEQNAWAHKYLPKAFDPDSAKISPLRVRPLRRSIEKLLSGRLFDAWERRELVRLQRKIRPMVGDAAEVICSPDQCKGHTGLHRQWVTVRYTERLRELGI